MFHPSLSTHLFSKNLCPHHVTFMGHEFLSIILNMRSKCYVCILYYFQLSYFDSSFNKLAFLGVVACTSTINIVPIAF